MCVEDTADGSTLSRRLLVCTGPCCNKGGISDLLLTELRATLLGAVDFDDIVGKASCVRRSCLGKCTGEPLAYVDPDGVWYHILSVENLLLILKHHILNEMPVQSLILEED
jgi:(2Fe-2S) ferredoxin